MCFDGYINKTVNFNYFGHSLKFRLSQSLFSSFDIDPGSRLLLKYIAPFLKKNNTDSVLDIGCGTGVLGLSVLAARPGSHCLFEDRDALASAFARENAVLNRLSARCIFRTAPAFTSGYEKYDLVVSNIPAKAGARVIDKWISETGSLLAADGIAAFVIVKPLAVLMKNRITGCRYTVLDYFENTQYAVCIFSSENHTEFSPSRYPLDLYIRNETEFAFSDKNYSLKTVYNLPDFDQLGFDLKCAFSTLKNLNLEGRCVFINPGQGHLPVFLYSNSKLKGPAVLCGRDSLSIEISSLNLEKYQSAEKIKTPFVECLFSNNSMAADFIAVNYKDQLPSESAEMLAGSIAQTVPCGGFILVFGKTAWINSFYSRFHGVSIVLQNKNKGFRSVLLKKVL